ncbi:MAG: hypothetical protein M0022_03440 [Desulfobacteraceae bacterium]|nr:hypothetical protein [Desulfobacteraceae bacterium]
MAKRILGINPGSKHLGYALFQSSELRDWGVKYNGGTWTSEKKKKIERVYLNLLDEFKPNYIALKKLHTARSSPELRESVERLKQFCNARHIPVYEYPIQYFEKMILSYNVNKKELVDTITELYPILFNEAEKERIQFKQNRKRTRERIYYTWMFEAVALAHVCFNQIDNH